MQVLADLGANELKDQETDLLKDVGRVLAHPVSADSEQGRAAFHAAKDLLKRYGRRGTHAFRAARAEVRVGV